MKIHINHTTHTHNYTNTNKISLNTNEALSTLSTSHTHLEFTLTIHKKITTLSTNTLKQDIIHYALTSCSNIQFKQNHTNKETQTHKHRTITQ